VADYDVVLSSAARRQSAQLGTEQQLQFKSAMANLLDDPAQDNFFVFPIDDMAPYQAGDFGLIWGELTVIFRFLNPLVVEIFDVWTREAD
jgi:hypothetical protein